MEKIKNVGLEVKKPGAACNDKKCPFHGDMKVRGRVFVGKVASALSKNTAKVVWERRHHLPKFERYEMRRTKIHAHNPECISAQKDDIVRIAECRPLSKTKHFMIIEKMGRLEKVEGIEEKPEEKEKPEEEGKKEKKEGKEKSGSKKEVVKAKKEKKGR